MNFMKYLQEEFLPIEVSRNGKVTGYMDSEQFKKALDVPKSSKRFIQDLLIQFNNSMKKKGDKTRVSLVLTKKKIGEKASSVPYN